MTGAQQDRSRVRATLVAAAIQSLKFVSREAQVEPLLAILDTLLIARYISGAAITGPGREALPMPLAVLVEWERWICSGSAPEHEVVAFCLWHGQASASQTRSAHVPLHCFYTDMSYGESAGEPKSPDLARHLVLLPLVFLDDFKAGVGATCTSRRFAIGTPRWWTSGCQNLVSDNLIPHMVHHNKCAVAVGNPMRFSRATTFLRRALLALQMQNARARHCTLHSFLATMLSIVKQVDAPEHHRAEQGHHRQHGGRASVRLYSRDDVWEALAYQHFVVQRVAEGFRPLTAQGRGAQIPLAEPTFEIDPLTIQMEVIPNGFDCSPVSRTKATEVRVATSDAHPNCRRPHSPSPSPSPPHSRQCTWRSPQIPH